MINFHDLHRVFQEDVDLPVFQVKKVNVAPLALTALRVLQDVRVTRVLRV